MDFKRPFNPIYFAFHIAVALTVSMLAVLSVGCDEEPLPDIPPDLSVTVVDPTEGPTTGGTHMVIVGTSIREGALVRIGGADAEVVAVYADSSIVVLTPEGVEGAVNVTVVNPDGREASLEGGFTYIDVPAPDNNGPNSVVAPDPLALERALPDTVSTDGGDSVVLIGAGFDPRARVDFGGQPAIDQEVLGDNTLVTTSPGLIPGRVPVTVTNPNGDIAELEDPVLAVVGGPGGGFGQGTLKLQSVHPNAGLASASTRVAVVGGGFVPGAVVSVGGVEASDIVVRSSSVIVATLPRGVAGPATVTVNQPDTEPASLVSGFTYLDDSLRLTDVHPAAGPAKGGNAVFLVGQGFAEPLEVVFGSAEALEVELINPRTARVVAPAGFVGAANVRVTRPGAGVVVLEDSYTYTDDSLALDAARPSAGTALGGSEVVIIGQGLVEGTTFLFDNAPAELVETDGESVARVLTPPHLPGRVNITARTPSGNTASLTGGYEFLESTASVFALDVAVPDHGPRGGGQPVVISGMGLERATQVTFDGVEAPIIDVLSQDAIVVEVPAGEVGRADIVATSRDDESSTLVGGYTFDDREEVLNTTIETITPAAGTTEGGTRVAIHGSGLSEVAEILFDDVRATGLARIGGAMITVVTPAGSPGPTNVTATLGDGRSLVLPNAFFYFDPASTTEPPDADDISPHFGPSAGGTPFVINGTRFAPGVQVLIGGRPATELRRIDGQTLTGRTPPAQRDGAADVAVYHPDGQADLLRDGFVYYTPDALAGPTITQLIPSTVSTLGGGEVEVVGSGFDEGLLALIDGVPAESITWGDEGSVSLRVPAHAPGEVTVTVVNPDGTWFDLEDGLTYVAQAPTLVDTLPTTGPEVGFTALTLRGAGFDPAATVAIGGREAIDAIVLSSSVILAITPPGTPGPADITVTNPGNLSDTLIGGYTYTEGGYAFPAPFLTAVTPNRAPYTGGSLIRVIGDNLRQGARMLFGSAGSPRVTTVDTQTASVTTPASTPGVVTVAFINPDGQAAILRDGFTFTDGSGLPPNIDGITPSRGPSSGGAPTILVGTGLGQGTEIFFGDVPAGAVAAIGDGVLSFGSPAHDPGLVDVSVTNADGLTATRPDSYTFVASPRIDAVTPSIGPTTGGTVLEITGSNFIQNATVRVGLVSVQGAQVVSDTLIRATTPPGALGPVNVVVRNPDGQEATAVNGFEYLNPPELESVWPPSGPSTGGTRVIVNGQNLRPGLRLYFGAIEATDVRWVDARRATAVTPAGSPGATSVRVVNADLQEVTLEDAFVWVNPSELGPAATVETCFPAAGATSGGTRVRVTGENYQPLAQVFIDGYPGQTGFADSETLAATTPPHAPATVSVSVTNPDGQTGSRAGCFQYTNALGNEPTPLVAAVQPDRGPTFGGADVVVTGDYFQDGAILLMDNRIATSINVVSARRIEAQTPPSTLGPTDVVVVNPDGKVGLLANAYTYLAPPTITDVLPNEGPSIGGTEVVILGEGFLPGASVRIGGVLASSTVFVSSTELHLVTPSGTPGPASINIINPDGQVGQLADAFTYNAPPVLLQVDPDSGTTDGGEFVRLYGSGFRDGAAVTFGEDASPAVIFVDGGELLVETPEANIGAVTVTVTNPDGFETSLLGGFTFVPPPSIQGIAPVSGPTAGGETVTITGRFFQDGVEVFFGDVPAATTIFRGPSVLEVVTPARAAGPAAVVVLNPDGQDAILPGGYVFIPPIAPPVINEITPNFGPVVGGTLAYILGADFQAGVRVFIGENEIPLAEIAIISASQLRVRIPASALPGVVDVRVLNPDGQEDALTGGFTYIPTLALPPLALTGLNPNRSPLSGGVRATVLGNGLTANVQFFAVKDDVEVPITVVTYYSPTAVYVELPAVPTPGLWDLRAYLPSTQTDIVLPEVINYRDYTLGLQTRSGRLPLETRGSDFYHAVTDLNNDGFNDIFILRDRYQSRIYLNRGAAEPAFFDDVTDANLIGEAADHYPQRYFGPIAADFNQDGFNDIVAFDIHYNNTNLNEVRSHHRIWASRGFGELEYSSTWARHSGAGVVREFVTADLDRQDGPDIFVCAQGDNYVLWNNGIERDMNGDPVLDMDGRPNWLGFDRQPFRATVGGTPDVVPREDSRGCRAADVNGDTYPDIVVANISNVGNRLYLSNGDPDDLIFTQDASFNNVGDTRAVEVVDLDHDGHNDIVFANYLQDDAVLMNNGAGSFSNQIARLCHDDLCSLSGSTFPFLSPTVYVGANPSSKNRVTHSGFLDINNDGCVDLFAGFNNDSYMPRAYINQKIGDAPLGCTGQFYYSAGDDAQFDPARGFRMGSLKGRQGLMDDMNWNGNGNAYDDTRGTYADFDNDGYIDLFQTFPGRQNRLYLRTEMTDAEIDQVYHPLLDATFEGVPFDMGHGRRGVARDLNGDGALDLIIANYGNCEWEDDRMKDRIYLNDGAGNFFDATERWPDQDILSTYEIVVEDFSGDGHPDILAFHEYEYNRTCHTAAGSLRPERTARSHGYFFGQVRYYQNDGFGFFENRTADANIAVNIGDRYGSIVDAEAVDVDNDGDLDIVAISSGRNYHRRLFINGGDPFDRGAPFFFDRSGDLPHRETGTTNDGCSEGHITCARAVTPIDFDRDGDQDLYLSRGNLRNRLFRNDFGVFTDVTNQYIFAAADDSYDAIADYFADTDQLDLFVVNNGRKRLHLSQADNYFGDVTDSHIPFNDGRFSVQGKSADFDMDGKIDVITASITSTTAGVSGPNSFYLNAGNGFFENWTAQVISPGLLEYTQDIVLGDFDNDGDLDAFYINAGHQNRLVENLLIDE